MRADMAKVIVERPRIGSSERGTPQKGYLRQRQRLSVDDVRREGITRPYRGATKPLNEHLGPLVRYLNRQVGRPWDRVFADICAHVRRDSAVQDHVRDHVKDFVLTDVLLVDGVPCYAVDRGGPYGGRRGQPLFNWSPRDSFYVCPATGLLRRVPRESKRQRRARSSTPQPPEPRVGLGKGRQLRCRDGVWYEVTLRKFPEDLTGRLALYDALEGRAIRRDAAVRLHGCAAHAVALRRLSRAELASMPIPAELLRESRERPEVVR